MAGLFAHAADRCVPEGKSPARGHGGTAPDVRVAAFCEPPLAAVCSPSMSPKVKSVREAALAVMPPQRKETAGRTLQAFALMWQRLLASAFAYPDHSEGLGLLGKRAPGASDLSLRAVCLVSMPQAS